MKKTLSLALVFVLVLAMCIPAAAVTPVDGIEHCYYLYTANKSALAVTPDGVVSDGEWDDAVELTINNDTIEDYGRWQSPGSTPADKLSFTYKVKWDEKNLYLLELRTDATYVSDFGDNDYTNAANPWFLDGTAFFFCDNDDPTTASRFDLKWYPYVDQVGGPSIYVGPTDVSGITTQTPGEEGIQFASKITGKLITFELVLPWAVIDDQGYLYSDIAEGAIFRFNPILINYDTIDDYASFTNTYTQINFHDCVNIPDEGVTGAEDPSYWAAIKLGPVAYTPETEAPVTDAPATQAPAAEAPATQTPAASQTADMGIIAALAVLAVASGAVLTLKKR